MTDKIRKPRAQKSTTSGRILLEILKDVSLESFNILDGFLFSFGSSKQLAKNIGHTEYNSAMQNLKRYGYVKRVNEDQFLITPKGIKKARLVKVEQTKWNRQKWDGKWRIIAFDIPETKKLERNIFRSLLKRKLCIGIQNSVFISPYADFDELAMIRKDLKIEKYVSFFIAKSSWTDDDVALRKRFGLED